MDKEAEVINRNDLVLRIRIANALSLFDDARNNIHKLIENYGEELTKEERNLFAVFYKSLLSKFHKEYDMYMDLQKEIPRREILKQRILRDNMYRARYEVVTICEEVIGMINNDILGTKNIELKIYFMKLRADYFRYWSSVASDDKFFSLYKQAENYYHMALELADKKLKRYHPLRLGLMLNMSIHYYKIPCERIKAIQLSMQAVTEGKEYVKKDPDIRAAVNLLQDNLNAWMADLGPREVRELELLEGARKWHGKRAAVPSSHLLHYLSGQLSPKFELPMPAHHRYFTIPQPLTRYDEFEYEPTYAWNVPLKPDIFVPETVHTSDKQQVPSTEPEMFVVEPQNTTTELQTTQTESQITTSTTTTSPTVLAAAAGLQTNVVDTDPISTKVPENMHLYTSHPKLTPPTISFHHASPEEHESDDEHESDEEHISRPDPFDGIFQPILSSSSSQSSSTTSSQPLDEDDEDNNGNFYHSSTSAPRDIPRTDQRRIPTTVDPTSGLTKRLLSFESRMLAIQRSQLRLEQAAERESEVEQPNEGSDSLPELCRTTSVATIEELQTPSNITSYVPQQIVTSEVSVPSYTQITSELGTAGESQPQPQNIPTDRIADNRDAKLQQQLTTSSYQSNINTFASLHQIDLSAQHQQHQSTSEAEPTKPSRTYEHLVFPEPAPPTPPPRVIFTPYGPKIVNFSPTSSLEGATAALSPSSSVKKKKSKVVTFDEKCTYWSSQSTIEAGTCCKRFPKQRSIRQRSTRPPPLRSTSVEKEQQVPSSPQNRGTQQIALPPQQDANLYQVSSYPQQLRRQSHTLESRRRRLAQRKRLRRSFSAPRNGAVWPLCSLVREPPYFIYKVLRRASASSRQVFGRRFLSVHSSAEDLYDEAAEKAFPDPWAPRGSRTMHNTFPITPWLPKEKPRVPWIRFQWPYRRSS